jgi:hypothetical protein
MLAWADGFGCAQGLSDRNGPARAIPVTATPANRPICSALVAASQGVHADTRSGSGFSAFLRLWSI